MKTEIALKPASFGSVSTGTLRSEDLLNAFHSALEDCVTANGDFLSLPENFTFRDRLANLLGEVQDCFAPDGQSIRTDDDWEETVAFLLNERLPDALSEFAPAYGYFGTLEGDGSDFGFWVNVEDVKEQVGFVSSKAQEYPDDDFRGEWLHVSDHGNATLYIRERGKCSPNGAVDREIWGIV